MTAVLTDATLVEVVCGLDGDNGDALGPMNRTGSDGRKNLEVGWRAKALWVWVGKPKEPRFSAAAGDAIFTRSCSTPTSSCSSWEKVMKTDTQPYLFVLSSMDFLPVFSFPLFALPLFSLYMFIYFIVLLMPFSIFPT